MNSRVRCSLLLLNETFITILTLIWFFTCMGSYVISSLWLLKIKDLTNQIYTYSWIYPRICPNRIFPSFFWYPRTGFIRDVVRLRFRNPSKINHFRISKRFALSYLKFLSVTFVMWNMSKTLTIKFDNKITFFLACFSMNKNRLCSLWPNLVFGRWISMKNVTKLEIF